MNRLLQTAIIIAFFISYANDSVAQKPVEKSSIEEKLNNASPDSNIGFKSQAPRDLTVQNPNLQQESDNSKTINQTSTLSQPNSTVNNSDDNAKTFTALNIDFDKLPADVQQKINANKLSGKNLLDGIAKAFTVEVKTCNTIEDEQKALSFLTTKKGFINSEFVSSGFVRIIVEPTFDSVELKDLMLNAAIDFNFLNEYYLVKKDKNE